ncbi:unnamed protein product [Orchesella dallaii]|uniref:Transmembrane protein n=1 Tax=Orchesella dallaii TaxID=48710 RepID=A0ABP1RG43_9HEXA
MAKSKGAPSEHESDSDDGGFLSKFNHLPTANNSVAEPVRIRYDRGSGCSSSYVLTTSRTVITVSMIFALLETILMIMGFVSLYDEFALEGNGIKIIALVVLAMFIGGEILRICVLSRWWGVSPQSDIEPNIAYKETIKCIRNSTLLLILVIFPISLMVLFFIYALASMQSGQILPVGLSLFSLVATFDILMFICFASPAAICAACFWRRVLKRHERGREYLRRSENQA